MSHSSLSPAEAERLECLAEEAAEVAKMCMKILRHGYLNYHPADPEKVTNKTLLANELGNLMYVKEQMHLSCDIADQDVIIGEHLKESNWPIFTYHQPNSERK